MPRIYFFKNIRECWFATKNLFLFEVEIELQYIHIVLIVLFFELNIKEYFPCFYEHRFKKIISKMLSFNEKTSGDIEIIFFNDLTTGISIRKGIHCDHTPFDLRISILGFSFMFSKYDHRHWDYDNDRYEEYKEGTI